MGRAGKFAVGAVIGGMALAIALVAALDPPAPRASASPQIAEAAARTDFSETLRRCRTVTAADPECEAAWEAKRRRFFGEGGDET